MAKYVCSPQLAGLGTTVIPGHISPPIRRVRWKRLAEIEGFHWCSNIQPRDHDEFGPAGWNHDLHGFMSLL